MFRRCAIILGVSSLIFLGSYDKNLRMHDANAATVARINPSDDGWADDGYWVYTHDYVEVTAGGYCGEIEFPMAAVPQPISQATLSVNPYGLPLPVTTIAVYGYPDTDGRITAADWNVGTFLGNWSLPTNLAYGQDVFFDVTTFLRNVSSPYVGFNLRPVSGGGADVFSSLEYNYGHPSQLTVTSIPEPSTVVLLGIGTLGLLAYAWRRRT
jgi:hypothetical protein